MRRWLRPLFALAVLAVLAFGLWRLTWSVAEGLVGAPRLEGSSERPAEDAEVEALRLRLRGELGEVTVRSDEGARLEVELPEGQDAEARAEQLAETLRQASRGPEQAVEVYLTRPNELDAELRVYLGPTLVQHLVLRPNVGGTVSGRATWGDRPLVALVVTDLGASAMLGQPVLEAPIPLTVAIRPFEAFSLVLAERATRGLKEVLLQVDQSAAAELLLPAVPHSSGTLLRAPLAGQGAEALGQAHHYVLDEGTATSWVEPETLRRARIEVLPVTETLVGEPEEWASRVHHLAERQGAVVLTVSVQEPAHRAAIRWLNSQRHLLKPAFAAEVLQTRP